MRCASEADIPLLIDLMADFYAEAGCPLDRSRAAESFGAVISDARLGRIWLIEADGRAVGHIVITFRYAMECGGMIACLDDLYVQPTWRNRGLSTAAINEVGEFCRAAGIRAMTVEVGFDNAPAQKVYRRAGFQELPNRQLLGFALALAAHEVA